VSGASGATVTEIADSNTVAALIEKAAKN